MWQGWGCPQGRKTLHWRDPEPGDLQKCCPTPCMWGGPQPQCPCLQGRPSKAQARSFYFPHCPRCVLGHLPCLGSVAVLTVCVCLCFHPCRCCSPGSLASSCWPQSEVRMPLGEAASSIIIIIIIIINGIGITSRKTTITTVQRVLALWQTQGNTVPFAHLLPPPALTVGIPHRSLPGTFLILLFHWASLLPGLCPIPPPSVQTAPPGPPTMPQSHLSRLRLHSLLPPPHLSLHVLCHPGLQHLLPVGPTTPALPTLTPTSPGSHVSEPPILGFPKHLHGAQVPTLLTSSAPSSTSPLST